MAREAIILAGGMGFRLRNVVKDLPKPMAPVAGKPFLYFQLRYLAAFQFDHIILSVGYKHEAISEYFGDSFEGMSLSYAIESEPLGTGGAIALSMKKTNSENVFILNGDTFFQADLREFEIFHTNQKSDLSIVLKEMHRFDRYGTVELEGNNIKGFREKHFVEKGLINGGIYLLSKKFWESLSLSLGKFSFEREIMEKMYRAYEFHGKVSNAYFIDSGIPEDYQRAQTEIPQREY